MVNNKTNNTLPDGFGTCQLLGGALGQLSLPIGVSSLAARMSPLAARNSRPVFQANPLTSPVIEVALTHQVGCLLRLPELEEFDEEKQLRISRCPGTLRSVCGGAKPE